MLTPAALCCQGDYPAINKSDTCQVGWWDARLEKYVIYVRLDAGEPGQPKGNPAHHGTRRIGRVVTADLADWGKRSEVFGADAKDSKRLDIYTSAAVRPSSSAPCLH